MKTVAPDYYNDFHCTAGKCRHSCCIGWEIDIDEDAIDRYRSVGGSFGQELMSCIEQGEDGPHFRLGEQERCPFLNEENLCRIIINLGEDALCGICADHPRFRNFFSSRTEIGLGLCCEAAAQLILSRTEPVTLTVLEDDGQPDNGFDSRFFDTRDSIIFMLQDRSMGTYQRAEGAARFAGCSFPSVTPSRWAEIYSSLERLDDEWGVMLDSLAGMDEFASVLPDVILEQLMVYFIYRHLPDSIDDGYFPERVLFAILSTRMIDALCAATGKAAEEVARMYSAEIEYSDENTGKLLEILGHGR